MIRFLRSIIFRVRYNYSFLIEIIHINIRANYHNQNQRDHIPYVKIAPVKDESDINTLVHIYYKNPSPMLFMPWKRKVVEERIKDGVIFFLIYNENGQLVGATGFDQKRNMFVHSLIDRKYRGNGYGRSMFLGLIELFKRHGIIELRAQALKRNNQAIKMFQNIGFEIIARESDDKYFTMVKVV